MSKRKLLELELDDPRRAAEKVGKLCVEADVTEKEWLAIYRKQRVPRDQWQSDDDLPDRRQMFSEILKYLLSKVQQRTAENTVVSIAYRLEERLYRNATSFEEYNNLDDLPHRLRRQALSSPDFDAPIQCLSVRPYATTFSRYESFSLDAAADFLYNYGFAVIEVSKESLDECKVLYDDYLNNIPEFREDAFVPYSTFGDVGMGSFGAINLPSAYYNPAKLRLDALQADACIPILQHYARRTGHTHYQSIRDRLFYRTMSQKKESWHCDETSGIDDGTDIIFGSLMGFGETEGVFTLIPGSHEFSANTKGGEFSAATASPRTLLKAGLPADWTGDDKALMRELNRREVSVQIPVNHVIIFNENILHRISGGKPKKPITRNALGHRLTKSGGVFFKDETARAFEVQGAPIYKGGEIAPPYAQLHRRNWPEKITAHAERYKVTFTCTLPPRSMESKKLPGYAPTAPGAWINGRSCWPSLVDTGLAYPPIPQEFRGRFLSLKQLRPE